MVVLGLTSAAILFILGWLLLCGHIAPGFMRRMCRPDGWAVQPRLRSMSRAFGIQLVAVSMMLLVCSLVHTFTAIMVSGVTILIIAISISVLEFRKKPAD